MLTFESPFTPEAKAFGPSGSPPEKLLYFDIETTGLSADTSSLYLIGCLYYRDKSWYTIQWFADDYQSEATLLTAFFTFMEAFDILIHYNGTSFDIPYLQKKCHQHRLSFSFDKIQSLDIYKELTPYKKLLPLPNLKQKTVEKALGICRKDKYDGGQLIQVYVEYIHKKLKQEDGCETCLSLLLLHNCEDLQGLLQISSLLLPPTISSCSGNVLSGNEISFELSLPYRLHTSFLCKKNAVQLALEGNCGRLTLFPLVGELRYFYPDYKNYYYLPMEDTAIHKSVATYVEKEYRQKAKASNCYTRRKGCFLPVPPGFFFPKETPLFYQEYKEKTAWFEITEDFLTDSFCLLAYLKESLK
ncbi:ribonuclease H-like domain-containing protein [Acetivibrio ethanolgignens]|uniref:YprB ribonuclease H-like domain-containing protein n=1 Tax=Acetivibrio ethanolgignens TaxID=290052 RepID=A0A0V8QG39_9FIRM|nr:ribonuclease H-like domain-containing protein [Acetivibrio ethanolgignens]KSV59524.1 hypothetical protein ASU35_08425 [Acetivibrio ethanolgignens]